jgi:5'/3'-nucleotidase SurE
MRILLTNDDGIEAPGLGVLEKIATDLTDDVWVVAPETDNSGASHSLTLAEPLRMRDLGKRHFAVKGTPTDCVIMGVRFLLREQPPDLVLSGVNRGQNLADDVTYSGTVAGAIQGTLLGVPSIAMSLVCGPVETGKEVREPPIWETPMQHGGELVRNKCKDETSFLITRARLKLFQGLLVFPGSDIAAMIVAAPGIAMVDPQRAVRVDFDHHASKDPRRPVAGMLRLPTSNCCFPSRHGR